MAVGGAVLSDQVKRREAELIRKLPDSTIAEALQKLGALLLQA